MWFKIAKFIFIHEIYLCANIMFIKLQNNGLLIDFYHFF